MKRPNIEGIRTYVEFSKTRQVPTREESLVSPYPADIWEDGKLAGKLEIMDIIESLVSYIEELESENRWFSINEKDAPRDGSHFLAVNVKESFGIYDQQNVPVMTVVHYFDGHFYPSVNTAIGASEYEEFLFTHWRSLPKISEEI